jgi:hypothetical protein
MQRSLSAPALRHVFAENELIVQPGSFEHCAQPSLALIKPGDIECSVSAS